jgi:hypothetical protein
VSASVLVAYAVGALLGLLANSWAPLTRIWPVLVRAQILLAAAALSVVAAWRLGGIGDVLWPLAMASVFGVMLAVSVAITPKPRRGGVGALRAWTGYANTGYWAIPIAGAVAGPAGVLAAVLVDKASLPVWTATTWLMRRDAPIPQRIRSSWIDQSPIIAFGVGLLLKATGEAPPWTLDVSLVFAPVLAATGAALFVGSVLHPTQRMDPRPGLRHWIPMVALRVLLFVPIVLLAPEGATDVVAVLCALSIPSFGPPQMSTVYGYREPSVSASARYGWVLGAFGLVAAYLLTR